MLKRAHRLQRTKDIQAVMRRGNRIVTPYLYIFYKRKPTGPVRSATIVGKKIHPSAVRRHRYQRWVREIINFSLSHIAQPYDMVWLARPSIQQVKTLDELRQATASKLKPLTK